MWSIYLSLNFQLCRHMGHCWVSGCEFNHFTMQCMWKQCVQAPQTSGQSSPGNEHSVQQLSNGIRHIPQFSSLAIQRHVATPIQSERKQTNISHCYRIVKQQQLQYGQMEFIDKLCSCFEFSVVIWGGRPPATHRQKSIWKFAKRWKFAKGKGSRVIGRYVDFEWK